MNRPQEHDLAARMAHLARASAAPRGLKEVLSDVTAAAKELIPGTDEAGILLVGKGHTHESVADTSGLVAKLDELQMRFNQGPCLQAAVDDLIVRTDDFREEGRWPEYSAAAAELGVLSGLSFKLYTGDQTAGALNLFALTPRAFTAQDETTGSILAAHAAAAILAARHGEQLQSALSTRDRIGQAKGIIMERYGVDDVRAFEMLRQLSQDSNTRLTDIATRVIETRHTATD